MVFYWNCLKVGTLTPKACSNQLSEVEEEQKTPAVPSQIP